MNKIIKRFIQYIPWALFQQYVVVLIYLSVAALTNKSIAWNVAVLLFMLAHLPNRFLMALALFVESMMLWYYGGIFSLAWMALVHAGIASAAAELLPFRITKGMKVLWAYKDIEEVSP